MSTKYDFYDSGGDYHADANHFNESSSKPLYQHQHSLPNLPVPSLQQTLQRLRPSVLPLAKSKEELDAFKQACQTFPAQAQTLQLDLEKRAADSSPNNNWLQRWWNQLGYLQVRDPTPINVSYFFQFENLSSRTQTQRGAILLKSIYDYSQMVLKGTLPQETIGNNQTTPLCSASFRYMFNASRIPTSKQDAYRVYNMHPTHQHAALVVNGHYFTIDLVNTDTNQPYTIASLESAIQDCILSSTNSSVALQLGVLTAANRDDWSSNSAQLRKMDQMEAAIEKLQSALILICLDDKPDYSYSQRAKQYLCGIDNRWYDKSLQFILTKNGNMGLNGEHSMMDGMPVIGLANYVLQQEKMTPLEAHRQSLNGPKPRVENIFYDVIQQLSTQQQTAIQKMVEHARVDFQKRTDSLDLQCLSFCGYGSDWIKSKAACSPDAFVQMAIQLAVAKHFADMPQATYESTQVRPFLYGRTETTRSVSPQSLAWTQAMTDPDLPDHKKLELLRTAADAHVTYIRNAAKGQGVDRHCFGLGMVASEMGAPIPDLLKDPLFLRAKRWVISTSTVPANPGFGPVVSDGLGIAYDIQYGKIYFTVTAYKQYHNAETVTHYLEEALLEMKELAEGKSEESSRSKL